MRGPLPAAVLDGAVPQGAVTPGAAQGNVAQDYPRPTKGILVAMTVRNCTLASSGRLAIYTTDRATCCTSIVGSTSTDPLACSTPLLILAVSSVAALPMSIWPQAMSYFRPSSEVDLVRPVIACFVAVYATEFGLGACAEMDPLLMMRPPRGCWSFIILKASHCSYGRSSSGTGGAPMPALLNSRSSRPKISFVLAKRARTDAGSLTSVGTTSVREPADFPSPAVASKRSLRRPARATA